MDFGYSDEQREFRTLCRRFAAEVIRPVAAKHDADESTPWEVMSAAREWGLHGMEHLQRMANDRDGQISVIYAEEHWHVGMIRQPIHSLLNPGVRHRIEWLPFRRANRYMADPFAIRVGPTTKLLMEEYDYSSRRGIIVESELTDGGGWSPPRPVLRAERHMAYPYLFEHRGEIWCTPENQDIRGVALYTWDRERRSWSHHDVILHDFPAVDPTIIRHGGHWWLFCTSRDDYPQAKLFLWRAPDLTGPWEPHPGNPVKVDVRSSRPAGTPFEFEGQLYRPAQDCSESVKLGFFWLGSSAR